MKRGATAAHLLLGMTLSNGWRVVEKLPNDARRTGGAFSVGYIVEDKDGRRGYCKALDFADALDADDPTSALEEMVEAYNFERDLMLRCGDRNLRRVVSVLDAGTVRVEGVRPSAVSYLILELADGDAHDLIEEEDVTNCLIGLRAAHHAAVGMNQLHSMGVIHQDMKPSNFLVWRPTRSRDWEGKVGDLGAAFDTRVDSPYDGFVVPGDPSYAAPECLYRNNPLLLPNWRQAVDMYMFGNLMCYLLTTMPFGAIQLFMSLDRTLQWRHFTGSFSEVLPYLVDAHGESVERIRRALDIEASQEIAQMIYELCYPDPSLRGDPVAHRFGGNLYSLHRYIARIDLLMQRVKLKRAGYT